jgi:hypothetical protein
MQSRKMPEIFDNEPSCRAQAASLRAFSNQITDPEMRTKLLQVAQTWDERADAYARIFSPSGDGFSGTEH